MATKPRKSFITGKYRDLDNNNGIKAQTIRVAILAGMYPVPCKRDGLMLSNSKGMVVVPGGPALYEDQEVSNLISIFKATGLGSKTLLEAYANGEIESMELYDTIADNIREIVENTPFNEGNFNKFEQMRTTQQDIAHSLPKPFGIVKKDMTNKDAERYLEVLKMITDPRKHDEMIEMFGHSGIIREDAEMLLEDLNKDIDAMELSRIANRRKALIEQSDLELGNRE